MRESRRWATSIRILSRPVALLLLVQLLSGVVLSPQRSFFPIYLEEQLRYAAVFISAFVAMGQLLGMVASVIGGALCDAVGRKWTLVLGLIGFVFGGLVYVARAPWLVALFWALGGLGLGFHTLGGQGVLIDTANPQRLGVLSAFYHWGFTLGGALSSPAAGLILDQQGFGVFGLTLALISLATVLGTMALLPSDTPHPNPSPIGRGAGVRVERGMSNRSLFGYGEIVRRPAVITLGLVRFLPTCYYGMASVLNPLLINRLAGSKTAVALYTTSSLVVATLAQVVAGRAADRWGRRWPTLVSFGALIFSAIGQAASATHLWSFYTFGVLGISAAWSLATLLPCLVADAAAVEERGRVLGMLNLVWNVGMMVGPLIGGALLEVATGWPFLVAALLNLGAIAAALSFFRLLTNLPVYQVTDS
ncbi:MAG: MFS transporter [Anaerolineae bacterium]|nr:MFS transporter [Anaerolineae bacterium]